MPQGLYTHLLGSPWGGAVSLSSEATADYQTHEFESQLYLSLAVGPQTSHFTHYSHSYLILKM